MLDFNFSEKEVEAARNAAEARGERLIVYPRIAKEDRLKLRGIMKKKAQYHREWLRAYDAGKEWQKPVEADLVEEQLERLQYEYSVDAHNLRKMIAEEIKPGQLSSVVISGHSEGQTIFGSVGAIEFFELEKILKETKVKEDIRSVYLWGCFTGTAGAMLRWRENYPDLDVVAGFEGRSPLADLKNSYELLEKLMIKEAEVNMEKTIVGVSRVVRSVNYEYLTGLTYLQGNCFVSGLRKKKTANILDLPDDCIGRVTFLLTKQHDSYLPFQNGERNLPNPDEGNNDLRHFYDNLQESLHCIDHCKTDEELELLPKSGFEDDQDAHNYDEKKLPCPGDVIKLIKFEHILENMNQKYSHEIKLFQEKIKAVAPDREDKCLSLFKLQGNSVRSGINEKIDDFVQCFYLVPASKMTTQERDDLRTLFQSTWHILKNTNQCVPLSWIDKQTNPSDLLCN